nr:NADH dehydrogenase subunit 5 [Tartessus sp.]
MVVLNYYLIYFISMMGFSMIVFIVSLFFLYNDYVLMVEYKFFMINSFDVIYFFLIDWMCLMFLSCVGFISSVVMLYSMQYMGYLNYSYNRFFLIVFFFVISMFMMIISPSLLSIMLGWDMLGLVSFCLVIYYDSNNSYFSGLITCLINRLGDIGLLISICWLFSYGSWHFIYYVSYLNNYIFYLVIFSSFTSSAQIPFSCWLPAAMAAPTPVSALVHSSTLVTAGIYLLIRFFYVYNINNYFFMFISLITMIMSSLCCIFEYDLKKIIAFSTLSQLGLMMFSLFSGMVNLSFFHMVTHAMFKSLLFLCSGIYIYYMFDIQDIRLLGSLGKLMPLSSCCMSLASMALCGFPFLSGFYSKDLISESFCYNGTDFFMFMFFYFGIGLTSFYSFRLFYYSMVSSISIKVFFMFESLNLMTLSVLILSFFSVFYGSTMIWLINFDLMYIFLSLDMKLITVFMVFLGVWFGYEFSFYKFNLLTLNYFNGSMWFLMGYSYYLYKFYYYFSFMNVNVLMNWGEYYGCMGISSKFLLISCFLQHMYNNSLKIFMLSFLFWFIMFL